jgi:hypothetical protein
MWVPDRIRLMGMSLMAASLLLGPATVASVHAITIGNEGCTPGYWKNHTENWEEYTPNTTLDTLFNFPDTLASFRNITLLDALQGGGGPGVAGATTILMRAATAAYLNAAHDGVGYPHRRFTEASPQDNPDLSPLETTINAALAGLDRNTMLTLAGQLDASNSLGCPLN